MKRNLRRAAGALIVSLALVAFTGTALAGGGHGDKQSKGDASNQPAQSPPDQQSSPAATQEQPKQAQKSSQATSTSDAGVKPSSTTDKATSCTTGSSGSGSVTCTGKSSKPDSSKQYGNGKTAAQIAAGNGAPAGTKITGPGNSQPHKVVSCKHEHAVDVHAVKTYSGADCSQSKPEQKPLVSEQQVTFCDMESATTGKLETKSVSKVISHELNGTPEEARDIVPAFTVNGQTYSQNTDATSLAIFANNCIAPAAAAPAVATHAVATPAVTTTTVPTTTVATTESAATTATVTTQATTVTTAGGVAGANATLAPTVTTQSASSAPQGGVLGATANLSSPKPHRGGVLGTAANVAGSSLPFTGFPLWIAVLIAVALIAAGLTLRGRGRGPATRS
jgi:hypothetical protein